MLYLAYMTHYLHIRTNIAIVLIFIFLTNTLGPLPLARAEDFRLPAPGIMVHLSPPLNPPILKGIKVHPDNPFRFDFILDKGDTQLSNNGLRDESRKLIRYFLASLTIPEKDLWVNLSPYEKDRIIPQSFGLTEMGRDLLAEDYMLKQITASLIYPEGEVGKKFWKRIYTIAARKYGTTNIPVNTFNKVWIVPEKAVVYENAEEGTAYVVESRLKVMLEEDYLSLEKHEGAHIKQVEMKDANQLGSQVVREIVVPELTREVNKNKNFADLRQVYNSLILAAWYKKEIKDSILEQVYEDKNKVAGVNINDPREKDRIYQRYLSAFKKGVFNYIKEELIPISSISSKEQGIFPKKYFSGGMDFAMSVTGAVGIGRLVQYTEIVPSEDSSLYVVGMSASPIGPVSTGDLAMKVLLGDGPDRKGRKMTEDFKGDVWIKAGSFYYKIWVFNNSVKFQRYYDKQNAVGNIRSYNLKEYNSVGSDNGRDYRLLGDENLSPKHFTFKIDAGKKENYQIYVIDEGSKNGTEVELTKGGIQPQKNGLDLEEGGMVEAPKEQVLDYIHRFLHRPEEDMEEEVGGPRSMIEEDLLGQSVETSREKIKDQIVNDGFTGVTVFRGHKGRWKITGEEGNSPEYKNLILLIELAINYVFTDDQSLRKELLEESNTLKPINTADGYHNFYLTPAREVLGLSEPLSAEIRASADRYIRNYVDGDLVRDIVTHLGGKNGRSESVIDILKEYFSLIHLFETADTSKELENALYKLINVYESYKFSKFYQIGRQKIYSRDSGVWKLFLNEENRISKLSPKRTFFQIVSSKSLSDFVSLVRNKNKFDQKDNFYIFHKIYDWKGRQWIVAARDGRMELYYTSQTYSKVAGQNQWSRQEAALGVIDDQGEAQVKWFAKPNVESAHDVSDISSNFINMLFKDIQPTPMTNKEMADIHIALGILFGPDGKQIERDAHGKNFYNGKREVDYSRYRGWSMGLRFVDDDFDLDKLHARLKNIKRTDKIQVFSQKINTEILSPSVNQIRQGMRTLVWDKTPIFLRVGDTFIKIYQEDNQYYVVRIRARNPEQIISNKYPLINNGNGKFTLKVGTYSQGYFMMNDRVSSVVRDEKVKKNHATFTLIPSKKEFTIDAQDVVNFKIGSFSPGDLDLAMKTEDMEKILEQRGGIDFTTTKNPWEIQNVGKRIKFHIDPAMLLQLQKSQGLSIGNITIQLLNSLQEFLGLPNPQTRIHMAVSM